MEQSHSPEWKTQGRVEDLKATAMQHEEHNRGVMRTLGIRENCQSLEKNLKRREESQRRLNDWKGSGVINPTVNFFFFRDKGG